MSDLIYRRDAVSRMSDLLMIELGGKRLPTWNEVNDAINDLPSAEPERKRGEWIDTGTHLKCSVCNEYLGASIRGRNGELYCTAFCPNCGADMRGGDDEVN